MTGLVFIRKSMEDLGRCSEWQAKNPRLKAEELTDSDPWA